MTSGTLMVVPSITFPESELRKITGIQYYEERMLFLLLRLVNEDLRIVYSTSLRVEEAIVDYYLGFIPPEKRPGDRLYLVALWDQEPRALTHKLLEQSWATERLAALADDAVLLTFNVTEAERELADRIGVPLYGAHPEQIPLGSKSGSRKVAKEAGVEVLPGAEDLFSVSEVEKAIAALRDEVPGAGACVVKLNNGFSGQGNVIVELDGSEIPLPGSRHVFCAEDEGWEGYAAKIEDEGAVVERLVRKEGVVSPSVQLRIAGNGLVQVLSTHDQILGGPDGQVYLGCRFPADERYRMAIQRAGVAIAEVLADQGVMGSFGIDLLVDGDDIYLSEINLRLGGTTHPFLMAKYVTGGEYDLETGHLMVDDAPRYYSSTDNLKSDSYVGLLPEQLIAAVDRAGLGFDPGTKTGVTLHLLGALKRFGKVGAVCIATSPEEADQLHALLLDVLTELAATQDPPD